MRGTRSAYKVARRRIELPTRGFSVHVSRRVKCLTAPRSLPRRCPISFRDTATSLAETLRNDQIILIARRRSSHFIVDNAPTKSTVRVPPEPSLPLHN